MTGIRNAWIDWREDVLAALPAWLTVRALIAVAWVVVRVAVDDLGQPRPQQLDEGLVAWDGTFYRDIAQDGYGALPTEALRFFPLLPILGRIGSVVALGDVSIGLVVVANLAALAVGALVHRLVIDETGDEALARRSVWATALFPGAFVLAWAYSEPVMLVGALVALSALRRRRWAIAGVAGLLAALARPLGLLLVIPALVEAARGWKDADRADRVRRFAAVAGPPVGLGSYLAWTGLRYGEWTAPLTVQGDFRGDAEDPLSRVVSGLGDLVGPEALGDGLHVPFAIGFLVLAGLAFRHWPLSFALFGAATLVAALAADNLNSLERYGLNAVVLALALASITRAEWAERMMIAVGSAGIVALTALAWTGTYVP